jgi:ribosomal protein S18 acetylase RimI-like enzyme
MHPRAMLAAFDEQLRRQPVPDPPAGWIEREDEVIRSLTGGEGWNGVAWSALNSRNADAIIAAQISRFAELGVTWEWKYYSHDGPGDLPERLLAAGFQREPEEALLVAAIDELPLEVSPPAGVELRPVGALANDDERVAEQEDLDALVRVHNEVFGGEHTTLRDRLLAAINERPSRAAAVVAWARGAPIASGRVEFHHGTEFASLWGGGTVPAWRHRGVFRSLVAHRAALAARRGFRYLQVDATEESQPVLRRLGFVELATTTPFTYGSRG